MGRFAAFQGLNGALPGHRRPHHVPLRLHNGEPRRQTYQIPLDEAKLLRKKLFFGGQKEKAACNEGQSWYRLPTTAAATTTASSSVVDSDDEGQNA